MQPLVTLDLRGRWVLSDPRKDERKRITPGAGRGTEKRDRIADGEGAREGGRRKKELPSKNYPHRADKPRENSNFGGEKVFARRGTRI